MTFAEQEFRERRRANPLKAPAAPVREAEPAQPGTYPCTPTDPLGMYGPAPGYPRALTADEMGDASRYFNGFGAGKVSFVADSAQIWSRRVFVDTGGADKTAEYDPAPATDADSGKHYRYSYRQIKLDPYRIIAVYGITHPAHQHALKKLLRAGKSVKSLRQDVREVQDALTRWLEMLDEDEAHDD